MPMKEEGYNRLYFTIILRLILIHRYLLIYRLVKIQLELIPYMQIPWIETEQMIDYFEVVV